MALVTAVRTRLVALYLRTHCNIGSKSVSHRRTRQVTQLFTYLLTHKLFSHCIRRYLVSRTCLRLSDASVICRVTYFQFLIQSALLACWKPGSCRGVRGLYPISNIGCCRNVEVRSLYAAYSPRGNLIDSNGKNGNYSSIDGQFSSEFTAICNHCGVMGLWRLELKSQDLKICWVIFAFVGKTFLTVKFSKFVLKVFTVTDRRCFVQISWNVPTGSRRNRALFTGPKKRFRLPISNCQSKCNLASS